MPLRRFRRAPDGIFPVFHRFLGGAHGGQLFGLVDQRAAYVPDQSGTLVDISRVELHEVGPGVEHRPHVVGRHQSAHADDGVGAARAGVDAAHDLHGAAGEGRSAEAAAADLFERRAAGPQPLAAVRAVGGHDAVERRLHQYVGDPVDHLVRHVGRDFEHDRPVLVLPAAEVEQRVEYLKNVFARVRRPFATGVVAADVHGEVVRILVKVAEEFQVVGRGVLGRGRGVLADVAPHDHPAVRTPQVTDGGFEAAVRKSDAVYDGVVLREPEDPRAGISRLGAGRDGAHLDESESQGGQFAVGFAVAVESRGDSHRIGEPHAEDLAFERRMLHGVAFAQEPAAPGDQPEDAQHQQDDVVGPLDVEREEQGFYDPSVHDAAKVLKSRMGAKPKCVRFGRTFRRDKRVVTTPKVVKID